MVLTGQCEEMCPQAEIKMRYEERLLHVLEMKQGTESRPKPLPELNKVVKCFSRSAAGREINAKELRTPQALQKTVNYLLYEAAENQIIPWNKTYDFIQDRLLAVRQEMVVQDISKSYSISLLQPIVKFYAYSAYRLCECAISDFDPVLNRKNLLECLKKLLVLYDEFDLIQEKIKHLEFKYNKEDFEILFKDCREFYEALYILFQLGDVDCIYRGLKLNKEWRTNWVHKALKISIWYRNGNWIRVCRNILKLPPLLAASVSLHLPEIRRKALERMSVAFSMKNVSYPIEILQKELLYANKQDLINDCVNYGIKCNGEIKFSKADFDKTVKTVSPKKEWFIIQKFINFSPSYVLESKRF